MNYYNFRSLLLGSAPFVSLSLVFGDHGEASAAVARLEMGGKALSKTRPLTPTTWSDKNTVAKAASHLGVTLLTNPNGLVWRA